MLQEKSAPAVAVVDGNGRLVGLVTSETIAALLSLRHKGLAVQRHSFGTD
jgi:hypothetical protein